jgi:hypothetical protein
MIKGFYKMEKMRNTSKGGIFKNGRSYKMENQGKMGQN